MSRWIRALAVAVATGGFISFLFARPQGAGGRIRRDSGAGTAASLLGLGMFLWLPSDPRLLVALAVALAAGLLVIHGSRAMLSQDDDPRIVLDEILGMWVAAAYLPRTWVWLAGAFLLFRVFDVWKPWPIRASQHWPGSVGILADDVLAGLYANMLLQLIRASIQP